MDRFLQCLKEIDAINAEDPHLETVDGQTYPKELRYSQRMTAMLNEFEPDASEILRLAARSQHIKRWSIPRDSFPMDRKGYLQWRTQLKKFHGELTGSIMAKNGYSTEEISRVDDLLNKRGLKADPEAQALEDVACLVFLRHYFDDFLTQHDEEKLLNILEKTWKKMSEKGRKAALSLDLSPSATALIQKALA
jgi:hypothetical protein